MNYGFIYMLANPCMPGIYKIGKTDRSPRQRCLEISSATACPQEFEVLFYMEVDNALMVERETHQCFAEFRINHSREFFKVCPTEVYDRLVFLHMCTEWVSPDMLLLLHKRDGERAQPALRLV